ncbi:putative alpha-N-arabinofuranosidase B [Acrodontium crateriforme]|uniref:Alpha-L-arabinofuranosidase n=1 Tax=Acrodontium crateriforme TaxID=150365 RepID=A0AAQ3R2G9_9PEZI|nr:putative alpha-N-arabinofuranosidase B [Acrodontium crateriforme]
MSSGSNLNLALRILATSALVAAGPCDIYASGNTPCVAAHSTTRALYSRFNGALYQVRRASDSTTTTIKPLSAGGVANSATQDKFCQGTTCLITTIYDQSGRGNHLTDAPPGGAATGPLAGGYDNLADASAAPITLSGKKVYGVYINPATGYRNDQTSGIATLDQPEGMYAVLDGTHYNDVCCFDYGNAETNNQDPGAAHMEAIYFGSGGRKSHGTGSGPWIMADLENGLYSNNQTSGINANNPSQTSRFVTAVVKGKPNEWAIRGAASSAQKLATYWDGPRPQGYQPMKKEGAIILGIGGDNSDGAEGTFYEGVMTSGYPSNAVEDAVQANIAAAKYAA